MSKANEPAYPMCNELGILYAVGLTKKERLAMEIYARMVCTNFKLPKDTDGEVLITGCALSSLRAADIFFEVMEKNSKV